MNPFVYVRRSKHFLTHCLTKIIFYKYTVIHFQRRLLADRSLRGQDRTGVNSCLVEIPVRGDGVPGGPLRLHLAQHGLHGIRDTAATLLETFGRDFPVFD